MASGLAAPRWPAGLGPAPLELEARSRPAPRIAAARGGAGRGGADRGGADRTWPGGDAGQRAGAGGIRPGGNARDRTSAGGVRAGRDARERAGAPRVGAGGDARQRAGARRMRASRDAREGAGSGPGDGAGGGARRGAGRGTRRPGARRTRWASGAVSLGVAVRFPCHLCLAVERAVSWRKRCKQGLSPKPYAIAPMVPAGTGRDRDFRHAVTGSQGCGPGVTQATAAPPGAEALQALARMTPGSLDRQS
jgi:hypothetical protein